MALKPKLSHVPRIRKALALYRFTSIVTGVFLLLLVLMMVLRYGFFVDIELGGAEGILALTPKELIPDTSINLSTIILIAHGWFYVVYLYSDFLLWSLMRWTFPRFVLIALGGVIPFLSFIVERRVHAQTLAELAELESAEKAETLPLAN